MENGLRPWIRNNERGATHEPLTCPLTANMPM
jgi:hypothetical protein